MIRSPFEDWYRWRQHYWPQVCTILGAGLLAWGLTGIELRTGALGRGSGLTRALLVDTESYPISNRLSAVAGAALLSVGILAKKPDDDY